MMTTVASLRLATRPRDNGRWLHRLLTDIKAELGEQPSEQVMLRIRARLLAELKTPQRAAA